MKRKKSIRLVALDTEVFKKANFNYQSQPFANLIQRVKEKKIRLYLTSITSKEIINHISKDIQKAQSSFEKEKIIHNSLNFQQLWDSFFKGDKLLNELKEQFDVFIKESEIEILELDDISSVNSIISKYFENRPPFNEGNKKHEFPDAFAIAVIEAKAKNENEKVYIISGDQDWLKASQESEHLIYKESVNKFLDDIIKEENDINLYDKIFNDNWNEIKNEISYFFIEWDFSLSQDFAHGDFEFGSEHIEVVVESIEIIDKYIVDIDDGEPKDPVVTFELNTNISYTAYISYTSTEYAYWDSEDHTYYGNEKVEGKVHQNVLIPIELKITLFRDDSCNLCFNSIDDVDIDPNNSFRTIELTPEGFEKSLEEFDSCFSS